MSKKKWCSICREDIEPNWSVHGEKQMCQEAVKWIMLQTWSFGRDESDLSGEVFTKFHVGMEFECPKCKRPV